MDASRRVTVAGPVWRGAWLAAALTLALPLGAQEDWERRAAEAAQTERGFYESGGARDPATTGATRTTSTREVPAHIEDADRKVQAQQQARLAAQLQAEQTEVDRLTTRLQQSRVQHGAQLAFLHNQKVGLVTTLAQTTSKKDAATLGSQIAAIDDAILAKTREITGYEQRMQLEIVKAQAEPRAEEQARRVSEAAALASLYDTKQAQIEAGEAEFQARVAEIDTVIRARTADGLPDVAAQFEKDKQKVIEAHQAWLASQQATLATYRRDLDRAYTQNRNAGIGPTSSTGLRSALRQEAVRTGADPEAALDLVDRDVVARTGESAARVASGAPKSTTHVSIFNEVSTESLSDFALDYAAEARKTYGSWEGFKSRVLQGYIAGVGEGAWDVVKDLFNLVVELGDLTGEGLEDALERMTGREFDVFGEENLEAARKILESADKLIRNEDGAGLEEARKLIATAEAIQRIATRKAEQMAGSGERGIREGLKLTGKAAANVVGIETVAIQGVAGAAKVTGAGLRLLRGADKAEDAATAARTASATGDAATAAKATDRAGDTATAARAEDAGRAATTGARAAPTITEVSIEVGYGTGRSGADEVLGGTVKLSDGTVAHLTPDAKLGAGSFSTTYRARGPDGRLITGPDGKPLVIKVTKAGDDGLDRLGYAALEGVDPKRVGVPTAHGGGRLGNDLGQYSGGSVTIFDEAPTDFKRVVTGPDGARAPDGSLLKAPGGKMTAGQAIAFDDAMRALNEKGYAWLDNKYDNYAFEHLGGDNWRLVIIDPGGIVPVKGLDPSLARRIQTYIDNPSWERSGSSINDLFKTAKLSELFDQFIDFDWINRITGGKYNTLAGGTPGESIPFNPQNGTIFRETNALASAETAEDLARVRTQMREAQAAGGGAGAPAGSGLVDRSAPTQLDSSPSANATVPPPVDRGAPTVPDVDAASAASAPTAATAAAPGRALTGRAAACPPGRAVGVGRLDLVSRVRSRLARMRSNIVPSHGEVISDAAKARNEVILVRPVNQYSTGLITDGYATKGMGIKGKSADWGPHAGTIPVDPKLSKLGNPTATPPTPYELRVYENYNKKALGEPYESPIKDDAGNITGWEAHDAVPAIAKRVQVEGPNGQMIDVLGDPTNGRPITADYDLFAVGNERGPGAVMSGHRDMGSISGNEIATADAINGGVKTAGYEGGNVVHHGPANRFENALNPKSDFPITAFTPDGNVHTIANPDELNDFYNTWNKLGYNLEAMPGWGLDPKRTPTGRFAPLAEDTPLANRAAAAGIVTAAQVAGMDEECPDPDGAVVDAVIATTEPIPEVNRPTTGGAAAAGAGTGSTAVAIGGGAGVPTIEPIYFEIGPGAGRRPEDETFTEVGKFFGAIFSVEVEQVYNVNDNNPFNALNPLAARQDVLIGRPEPPHVHPPTEPPEPPPSGTVQVISNIPIVRLNRAGADACPEVHYHGAANDCNGVFRSDPAPGVCGHGTEAQVMTIPRASCPDFTQ